MNNVTGLPITIDQYGPTYYSTRAPVYVFPPLCKPNGKGEYPGIRQLQAETGMTVDVTEDCKFMLVEKIENV